MADDSFLNSAGFGVIVGAIATFAGTYWAGRKADRQQVAAQEHERRLKREEQEFDCKRSALSNAAAATARHFLYLANALDRPVSDFGKSETAAEFSAAHSELHLYVGIDTIESSQELARCCGLFADAVARAMLPMEFAEADAGAKKIEIENFHHLLAQKQSEIEVLLQDQKGNAPLIAALYQAKVNLYKDLSVAQEKYHDAISRKNQAKRDALPIVSEPMIAMIPSMTAFLIAARKELGMTIAEARYKAVVQKNADAAQALIADMLTFVDKAVADEIAKNR